MSCFLPLAVGTIATFSTMMFSTSTMSSLYDIVVPLNLKFSKLSGINFLTASIFSSSLILPDLFSNLFSSFVNVLKMSSHCSTSFALSFSEMLLISVAYADFLSDFVPLVVPSHYSTSCFESLLSFRLLHYSQWFVGCRSVHDLVQRCLNWSELNSSSEQSNAITLLSNLSTLSTWQASVLLDLTTLAFTSAGPT